ncbi:E3 ubiquitin-protein ligase dtx3l [Plakobranchus ocellatus]|uniref:RING-type E3 ubiquitin transferase n=1 Tax=Plakobranchus ocellatus TaxID=259542 RepID=A0AAV3XVS1_9GAST|nr:E3 ubiquitin-protein ligase dtx3l [Plakobranchus ocellatus]
MPTAITAEEYPADEKADNLEHDINKAVEGVSNKKYDDASPVSSNETDCFETTFNKSDKEVPHAGTVPLQTVDSCSHSEQMADKRDSFENDTSKKSIKGAFTSHDSKEKMDPSYGLEDQTSEGNVKHITSSHDSKEKTNPKCSETRRACMGEKRTSNYTEGELKEEFSRNQLMRSRSESSKKMIQSEGTSILSHGKPEVEEASVIKECRTRTRCAVGKIKQSGTKGDCYSEPRRANNQVRNSSQQTQATQYEEHNETWAMDTVRTETTKGLPKNEEKEKKSECIRNEEREKKRNEEKEKTSKYTRNEERKKPNRSTRNEEREELIGHTRNVETEKLCGYLRNEETKKPSGYPTNEEREKPSGLIRSVETEKPSGLIRNEKTEMPSGYTGNEETEKPSGFSRNEETEMPSGFTRNEETEMPSGFSRNEETEMPSGYIKNEETEKPSGFSRNGETEMPSGFSRNEEAEMPSGYAGYKYKGDKVSNYIRPNPYPGTKKTTKAIEESSRVQTGSIYESPKEPDEPQIITNSNVARENLDTSEEYFRTQMDTRHNLQADETSKSDKETHLNILTCDPSLREYLYKCAKEFKETPVEARQGLQARETDYLAEIFQADKFDKKHSYHTNMDVKPVSVDEATNQAAEKSKISTGIKYCLDRDNEKDDVEGHKDGSSDTKQTENITRNVWLERKETRDFQTGQYCRSREGNGNLPIEPERSSRGHFKTSNGARFQHKEVERSFDTESNYADRQLGKEYDDLVYGKRPQQAGQIKEFDEKPQASKIGRTRHMPHVSLERPSTNSAREDNFPTSRQSENRGERQDRYVDTQTKSKNELSANQFDGQIEIVGKRQQASLSGERHKMAHGVPAISSQRQTTSEDIFFRSRQSVRQGEGQQISFDVNSEGMVWDEQLKSEDVYSSYDLQERESEEFGERQISNYEMAKRSNMNSDFPTNLFQKQNSREDHFSKQPALQDEGQEMYNDARTRKRRDAQTERERGDYKEQDGLNRRTDTDLQGQTNQETEYIKVDIKINCHLKSSVLLLSSIVLLPKKRNWSSVNVSVDQIEDSIISLSGEQEEVQSMIDEIRHMFGDERSSLSFIRYKSKQQLPAENISSVRGSSLSRKTYRIDPEQDIQRSNLGGASGLGRESSVDPPGRTLSGDLVTRNSGIKVKVLKTDITAQRVDAIVNAANSRLKHGGGVAKAIADKAGSDLVLECSRFTKGEKKVGVTELFVSSGGKLPARHVIHAVGPNWKAYKEERKEECARDLRRTVLNCLLEAAARGCHSIAIPSISAAIFGVPHPICTKAYLEAVQTFDIYNERYLKSNLKEILFVDIMNEMVGHIQRQFRSGWEKELPLMQVSDDFQYARKLCEQKDFKKSQPDERGYQPEQTSPVTQSVSNTQRSFSAPRPTLSSSEATSQKLAGYLYSVGGCNLCASAEPALRQRPDLVVLIGQLFKNLHWSPVVDVEREININVDFPNQKNIFAFLGGKRSFPLIVQFHLDKYDQQNLDWVFNDVGNYWSIIRTHIKQVQSVVFTCAALYSGSLQAGRYPYLVDDKFLGAFTRNVYEFLMKSKLQGCNVTIAAGSEAMTKVHKVLESRQPASGKSEATGGPSRNSENSKRECGVCFQDNAFPNSLACCNGDLCRSCKKKCQVCPFCRTPFKLVTGDQPKGTMNISLSKIPLKGYERHGSYEITYLFPSGTQQSNHPDPGKRYDSVRRTAYVPASSEGHQVLRLLRLAFLRCLTFTIGVSHTTGRSGVIVWNDIHHKTSLKEGSPYAYPDSNYLKSVTEDLAAKNVTESSMTKEEMRDLSKLENDLKFYRSFKDL